MRGLDFYKKKQYNNYRKINKGGFKMSLELARALLVIAKYCASCDDCSACPLHDICGKIPLEW